MKRGHPGVGETPDACGKAEGVAVCENAPEYFIPTDASRERNLRIWAEVARRFDASEPQGEGDGHG